MTSTQGEASLVGNGKDMRAESCPGVKKALGYYRQRESYWRKKVGAASVNRPARLNGGCPYLRWKLKQARKRAQEAHRAYEKWSYNWEWWKWLPDKYARVGACETGYGKKPGNWLWDSGTYVSAFGIYRAGYNQFASYLGLHSWDGHRSPREQYRVAAAIQARFGWSAWGCGGA